eukprot:358727-Chlamydomonas_euryale.AAC.6
MYEKTARHSAGHTTLYKHEDRSFDSGLSIIAKQAPTPLPRMPLKRKRLRVRFRNKASNMDVGMQSCQGNKLAKVT